MTWISTPTAELEPAAELSRMADTGSTIEAIRHEDLADGTRLRKRWALVGRPMLLCWKVRISALLGWR